MPLWPQPWPQHHIIEIVKDFFAATWQKLNALAIMTMAAEGAHIATWRNAHNTLSHRTTRSHNTLSRRCRCHRSPGDCKNSYKAVLHLQRLLAHADGLAVSLAPPRLVCRCYVRSSSSNCVASDLSYHCTCCNKAHILRDKLAVGRSEMKMISLSVNLRYWRKLSENDEV